MQTFKVLRLAGSLVARVTPQKFHFCGVQQRTVCLHPRPVRYVRDLGIYIDSDASMRTHISTTVSDCFAAARQLRRARRSVSQHVPQSLVTSLIMMRLGCGSATVHGWHSWSLARSLLTDWTIVTLYYTVWLMA